ncbi:unnamed protein product [Candida verbasci]|uniref:NDT80 domain-containing protein n=1 Tax=Candida verbasci TaxID=1227364 RepID=A0A9W4X806_9ASCO|nr:unnamed protein product [Candida verbasci]
MDSSNKDRLEDLALLFLPDILNTVQSTNSNTNQSSPNNQTNSNNSNNNTTNTGANPENSNDSSFTYHQTPSHQHQQHSHSSYQDFLNNNNFINRSTENMLQQNNYNQQLLSSQYSHMNHFNPYYPYEQQSQPSQQQIAPPPTQQPNQLMYQNQYQQIYQQTPEPQQILQPNQQQYNTGNYDDASNVVESSPKKKKQKGRKKDFKHIEYQIDLKPSKLKSLLDFKPSGITSINDYKIIDKYNNEVQIEFSGFLNGRFLTNDIDNNNYIFTKNELNKNKECTNITGKVDPKVISCYRRNYIQINMNLQLKSMKSKLLKLICSEYGYQTTRVIKYFKIEISACTNLSNSKSVGIIIKKEEQKKSNPEYKEDLIVYTPINNVDTIINLQDAEINDNNEIEKFYTIKKLQFKNATPNNGNLTFQNYYHLKVKLSCIVADIYFDDYIEEDEGKNEDLSNTNEIILSELVSTPIIVRGRNPSFYSERKDLLIKGRSPSSKKSFRKLNEESLSNFRLDSNNSNLNIYSHTSSENEIENDNEHDIDNEQDLENEIDVDNELDLDIDANSPISTNLDLIENNEILPNLSYSTNNSNNLISNPNGSGDNNCEIGSNEKYKYFPISSVYYLPPVNVVYFPHRAHHPNQKDDNDSNSQIEKIDTRSSNVYFK